MASNDDNGNPNFSSLQIPIGTHSSQLELNPRETRDVYVGRQNERSKLITLLLQSSKNLSVLVTGQRGAGKSSFVDHCLNEYRQFSTHYFVKPNYSSRISEYVGFVVCLFSFFLIFDFLAHFIYSTQEAGETRYLFFTLIFLGVYVLSVCNLRIFRLFSEVKNLAKCVARAGEERRYIFSVYDKFVNAYWIFFLLLSSVIVFSFSNFHITLAAFLTSLLIIYLFFVLYLNNKKHSKLEASITTSFHFKILQVVPYISTLTLVIFVICWIFSIYLFFVSVLPSLTSGKIYYSENLMGVFEFNFVSFKYFISLVFLIYLMVPDPVKTHKSSVKIIYRLILFFLIMYFTSIDLLWGAVSFICILIVFALEHKVQKDASKGADKRERDEILKKIKSDLSLTYSPKTSLGIQAILSSFKYFVVIGFISIYIQSSADQNELTVLSFSDALLLLLLINVIYFVEYRFIVNENIDRVYEHARSLKASDEELKATVGPTAFNDRKISGKEWNEAILDDLRTALVYSYRKVNNETLPNLLSFIYRAIIKVPLNLGFKEVDRKSVIHSMLSGLGSEYAKNIGALSSFRKIFLMLPSVIFVLFLSAVIGHFIENKTEFSQSKYFTESGLHKFFSYQILLVGDVGIRKPESFFEFYIKFLPNSNVVENQVLQKYLSEIDNDKHIYKDKVEGITGLNESIKVIDKLDLNAEVSKSANSQDNVIQANNGFSGIADQKRTYHLNKNREKVQGIYSKSAQSKIINLYVILTIFAVSYLYIKYIGRLNGNSASRIYSAIMRLTSATTKVESDVVWKFANWVSPFTNSKQNTVKYASASSDPRVLEQEFLDILDDMSKPAGNSLFFSFFTPNVEVTFVLDELDKVGARHELINSKVSLDLPETLKSEITQRQLLIESLLSDLKNIITKGQARFIFVGGREINDTWLADHTDKNPLFTSIFSFNIYIPSLLNDDSNKGGGKRKLNGLVQTYIFQQYKKSQRISRIIEEDRDSSFAMRRAKVYFKNTYSFEGAYDSISQDYDKLLVTEYFERSQARVPPYKVFSSSIHEDKFIHKTYKHFSSRLLSQIAKYLTYRSHGYPKKLEEVYSELIEPLKVNDDNHSAYFAKDGIVISDIQLTRIQFLASVFSRHVSALSSVALRERDDKVVNLLFTLSDFLFKFHKRGFSLESLDRVEALADVHRDPTVRYIVWDMVNIFKDLFLNRIRNGLYGFVFRSEITNELKYLSGFSPIELAALNFTLDESQSLKSIYIAKLKDGKTGNADLTSFLGEVYEFDEEFDTARKEYLRAMTSFNENSHDVLDFAGGSTDQGQPGTLSNQTFNIKMLLKIGMTYEQSNDYEKALSSYEDAKQKALSFILQSRRVNGESFESEGVSSSVNTLTQCLADIVKGLKGMENIAVLVQNLNYALQSMVSQAWLHEKMVHKVDTSIATIGGQLSAFETQLKVLTDFCESSEELRGYKSDVILILAELYNKCGDLFFLKGSPVLQSAFKEGDGIAYSSSRREVKNFKGNMARAHLYYRKNLENVLAARASHKDDRPNSLSGQDGQWDALEKDPSFISRTLSGALVDFGDTSLAQISVFNIFGSASMHCNDFTARRAMFGDLRRVLTNHQGFFSSDFNDNILRLAFADNTYEAINESDYTYSDYNAKLLDVYLTCNKYASTLLYENGYPEDAAKQFLRSTDVILGVISWAEMCKLLIDYGSPDWSEKLKGAMDEDIFSSFRITLLRESVARLAKVFKERAYSHLNPDLTFTSRYFVDLLRNAILTSLYTFLTDTKCVTKHAQSFLSLLDELSNMLGFMDVLPLDTPKLPELKSFSKEIKTLLMSEPTDSEPKRLKTLTQDDKDKLNGLLVRAGDCCKFMLTEFMMQFRFPMYNRLHAYYHLSVYELKTLGLAFAALPLNTPESNNDIDDWVIQGKRDLDSKNRDNLAFFDFVGHQIDGGWDFDFDSVLGFSASDDWIRLFSHGETQRETLFDDKHLRSSFQEAQLLARTNRVAWLTLKKYLFAVDMLKNRASAPQGSPLKEVFFEKFVKEGDRPNLESRWKSLVDIAAQSKRYHGRTSFALIVLSDDKLKQAVIDSLENKEFIRLVLDSLAKKEGNVPAFGFTLKDKNGNIDQDLFNFLNRASSRAVTVKLLSWKSAKENFDLAPEFFIGCAQLKRRGLLVRAIKCRQLLDQVLALIEDFDDLVKKYDAHLYFPLFKIGFVKTCLYQLFEKKFEGQEEETRNSQLGLKMDRVRYEAQNELRRSAETHSLGREYYESIQRLYYFYDHFNDRQLHSSHALRMLFSDFSEVLLYLHAQR